MMRWRGEINIAKPGLYYFMTESDDGSRLYIDKTMVVDNDGLHGMTKKTGQLKLKIGWHKITVTFFENSGGACLKASIMIPKYLSRNKSAHLYNSAPEMTDIHHTI